MIEKSLEELEDKVKEEEDKIWNNKKLEKTNVIRR